MNLKLGFLVLSIISYCAGFVPISLSQCQRSKACFKGSKSCTIDQCHFVVTWKVAKFNDRRYLEIEMLGTLQLTGGYIAMGFSEDKEMGNDGIVACYARPGESKVNIVAGYNEADTKNNIILSTSQLDKDFLATPNENLYGGNFNSKNNKISCRFLRLMTPTLQVNNLKDLGSGNKYYLFVAMGPDVNPIGLDIYFPGSNTFTETEIDFAGGSYNTVIGSSEIDSPLAKAHGILMLISWITCCSVATLIARYYKDVWVSEIKVEQGWFNPHRGLQGCAFILIVIAMILIIPHVGGYSKLEDYPSKAHPVFGLISIILFFINPFIALCRCKVGHANRPYFNWFHFFIGLFAYILSVPAIMTGLKLPGAGFRLSQLNYPQVLALLFFLFQFIIELILELYGCYLYKENQKSRNYYEMEKKEYNEALEKNLIEPSVEPVQPRPKGRHFKLIILGLYITAAIIITFTLSIIIMVN